MSYDRDMAKAVKIDAQLRARMRQVRDEMGFNEFTGLDRLEAAWQADLGCQSLRAESRNAWAKLGVVA